MIIKIFFLAAAGAMFGAMQSLQKPASPRLPANTNPTLIYAVPGTQSNLRPLNFDVTQQTYTYNDVIAVYENAVVNDNILHQNHMTLQGMLAQAKAQPNDGGSIYDQASPYNTRNKNVQKLEYDLTRLKAFRSSSMDTAYMRLWLTYATIQKAPTDGRKGLTHEQHVDAKKKLEHLLALKQAIRLSDSAYFQYPLQQTTYLTAGLYAPQLLAPPVIEAPTVIKTAPVAIEATQNDIFINNPAPVIEPITTEVQNTEGLVEPVLQ